MDRAGALELVKAHVSKEGNLRHMVAVGAVMRQVALCLGEDPEAWEVIGILHDIDIEECHGREDHTLIARDILRGMVPPEMVQTILAHNFEASGVPVDDQAKRALVAADAVSGLVMACALVLPSRRLTDLRVSSISKKFGNKDFARGVDRERIMVCEQLGIPRDELLSLALEGMRARAEDLDL